MIVSVGRHHFAAPGEQVRAHYITMMRRGHYLHQVRLACLVRDQGPLVRLWKQGARVIFAGDMQVRDIPTFDDLNHPSALLQSAVIPHATHLPRKEPNLYSYHQPLVHIPVMYGCKPNTTV